MDFPKVSIITVVYNAADALSKTIESVSGLKYPHVEYIIVDGNSTDGTKSVIEQNYLSITQWVSEPDKGIYDAMNKGLLMATGEYVWFLNAGDTIFDPYVLQNIFAGRENYADLYYGETLIKAQNGDIVGLRRKRPSKNLRWTSFRRGMTVCHQSIIVNRSVVPFYDLSYRYSADFDWVIAILRKRISVYNTRRIISVFELGGATTNNHTQSLKERFSIMKKYYGLTTTILSHIAFCFNVFTPKTRRIKL